MIRIAITGPESSGKSWLAISLSRKLQVPYIPELARFILQEGDGHYQHDDLLNFMRLQAEAYQRAAASAAPYLVQDSDWNVFEVWESVRFGQVSPQLEMIRKECPFDHYLLCSPDLPWEYDPLRENENDRDVLFEAYRKLLDAKRLPYTVISGEAEERLEKAMTAIATLK